MDDTTRAEQQPLTHRETMWIVGAVLVPAFMGSLDQTVVSTSLPTIGQSFGASSHLSWVMAINLLTATATTPLYGKISDIYGRRLSLLLSIGFYVVGALVAATAVNLPMLIVGRGIQGLGTGGLISVPMTILGDIVAPKYRARYYTYFSMTYITSGFVGPAFGGFISQHFHWSVIFWINVPMGLVALAVVGHLLKKLPRYERPHKLDLLGSALIVMASTTAMFVLNAGGRTYAWNSLEILIMSTLSAVMWIAFVWRLLSVQEPLIPLSILRNSIVFFANMSNALGWATLMALNIYLPMYLQAVHGLPPVAAALYMIGLMSAVNGSALVSAQIAGRITHYKYPPLVCLVLCIAASFYLAVNSRDISLTMFEVVIVLIGMGFGPVAPVSTVAMQNAVPLHQMGISISTMAFIRSLMATGMVAAYGVIVLGNLGGNMFGDRAQAAANFQVIFYATAAGFILTFISLALMKEVPLQQNHKGS